MSELSEFEEMYLKRIFEAHFEQPDKIVKTTQLAEMMNVSPASTTEMIQRLALRGFVTHIPYRGSRLTSEGFLHTAKIKRREALLQILLREIIGFQGDVDEISCKMEHAVDDELESRLDEFLGFPELHLDGNKIPQIKRTPVLIGSGVLLPIQTLPPDTSAIIEVILSGGVENRTIQDLGIEIGQKIIHSDNEYFIGEKNIQFSEQIGFRILARTI
ncbi:MAG: metal-dependent transcriptional regulator [Euryarchaeota archaeon]|jgi:DtxR family Mn-dependent transcriptional regulator|nr:metal-dependent transcriptional regulator [Euryarchaeota archaeon]MBT5508649.1 metal-dependent transcriptional regulator [Euryarchaeota archaeon]